MPSAVAPGDTVVVLGPHHPLPIDQYRSEWLIARLHCLFCQFHTAPEVLKVYCVHELRIRPSQTVATSSSILVLRMPLHRCGYWPGSPRDQYQKVGRRLIPSSRNPELRFL